MRMREAQQKISDSLLWSTHSLIIFFPFQVIAHVLYYVPPYERLNLAFTASNWAQALYDPVLMEDVSLVIESCHQMEAFLSRSRRKHQNLRILNGMSTKPTDLHDKESGACE